MWFSVRTARIGIFKKMNFWILDFWPQILIPHAKITLDSNFDWFWRLMTPPPGGSKSKRGQNMKMHIFRIFVFFSSLYNESVSCYISFDSSWVGFLKNTTHSPIHTFPKNHMAKMPFSEKNSFFGFQIN